MGVQINLLHFVVEVIGIGIIKGEVEDADGVDRFQLLVPFATFRLFANGESRIEHAAVLEELLLPLLHLH